jgi:hypothetical protein
MTSDRARDSNDTLWAAFEAEALPHIDRLFRLAMWLEKERGAAEDLVQETLKRGARVLSSVHVWNQLSCLARVDSAPPARQTPAGEASLTIR